MHGEQSTRAGLQISVSFMGIPLGAVARSLPSSLLALLAFLAPWPGWPGHRQHVQSLVQLFLRNLAPFHVPERYDDVSDRLPLGQRLVPDGRGGVVADDSVEYCHDRRRGLG